MITTGHSSTPSVTRSHGQKSTQRSALEVPGVADYDSTALYKMAKQLAIEVHRMTLKELPSFEADEQGPQIRRSSKLVVTHFVDAYSRRQYRAEYMQALTHALAACNTTKTHLEMLHETNSLVHGRFIYLYQNYCQLAEMLQQLSMTTHE
jgi:four helix bundle protein